MSEQQKPNPQTIINVQQQEISRLNDNRIYLMAVIEDLQKSAQDEIGRLSEEISLLKTNDILVEDEVD